MSKKIEIQKLVFKSINQPDRDFLNSLEPLKEEMGEYINEHNLLDSRHRQNITWLLQIYVEKVMHENLNYDDLHEIIEMTLEKWNAAQNFKLDYKAVEAFILHLYQSMTMRKAFGEICEGDIENYKVYTQQPDLFMDYLIRYLFSTNEKQLKVLKAVARKVYDVYFEGDTIKAVNNTFNRLGLGRMNKKNGKPRFDIFVPKAFAYSKIAVEENAPFLKGFEKIFKDMITSEPTLLEDEFFAPFFKQFTDCESTKIVNEVHVEVQKDAKEVEEVDFEVVLDLLEPTTSMPTSSNEIQETEIVEPIKDETPSESTTQSSEFIQNIDDIIERLQQTKKLAEQLVPEQKPQDANQDRMAIAAEEIERLQRQLAEEQHKSKMIEESSVRSIIEYIGGHKGSYNLSDLYRESMGESTVSREVVQGQLMDFFDLLANSIGLEVHGNGHSVGDEFSVSREEIARSYKVLSDLQSDNEEIPVQLVQYGWTLNGKVVVQPLIKQLKGVL